MVDITAVSPLSLVSNAFEVLQSNSEEEWLKQRTLTVTATDAARLFLRPHPGTIRDIRKEKENPAPIPSTPAMEHGHEREPEILRSLAEHLGLNVFANDQLWTMREDSRFSATPDGFILDTPDASAPVAALVECKTTNARMGRHSYDAVPPRGIRYFEKDEFGDYRNVANNDAADGKIPAMHMGQMIAQAHVAGVRTVYYCTESHCEFDPNTFELTIFKVDISEDDIEELRDAVEYYYDYEPNIIEASNEIDELIIHYQEMHVLESKYKREKEKIRNEIRRLTGAGVQEIAYGDGSFAGKITATWSEGTVLDKVSLEKHYPGLLDEYQIPKEYDKPTLVITASRDHKKAILDRLDPPEKKSKKIV